MGDRVAEDREPSSSSSGCAGLTSTSTAYADYQKKTTHEIPLVELGPIGRAAALAARGGGASFLTMPKQRVGDIDIYYEAHGDGPQTLVMVRGLGSNLCALRADPGSRATFSHRGLRQSRSGPHRQA